MANKKAKPKAKRRSLAGAKRLLFLTKAILGAKYKDRARCMKEMSQLNIDIPNLERTVRALEAQLGGKTDALTRVQFPAPSPQGGGSESDGSSLAGSQSGQRISPPSNEIPPEVLAQLPPELQSDQYDEEGLPKITGVDPLEKAK